MSVPCPVPMLPGVGGKAAVFVFAILIVMAIAAAQSKPTAVSAKSQP